MVINCAKVTDLCETNGNSAQNVAGLHKFFVSDHRFCVAFPFPILCLTLHSTLPIHYQ